MATKGNPKSVKIPAKPKAPIPVKRGGKRKGR
jgi:hypothetical protein